MGRPTSNVYDFYDRIEPNTTFNHSNRIKYECKVCKKHYAANATKLGRHLQQGCHPTYTMMPALTNSNSSSLQVLGSNNNLDGNPSSSVSDLDQLDTASSFAAACSSACSTTNSTSILDISILNRLATLSTCNLADAMSKLKLPSGVLNNINLIPGTANTDLTSPAINLCGQAYTVEMTNTSTITTPPPSLPNYTDTIPRDNGVVLVIKSDPAVPNAVMGGLLATTAKMRGAQGIVTNGRVRDVEELHEIDFPAFASGTAVAGRSNVLCTTAVAAPISICNVRVRTMDIVRADTNGVVVIPYERVLEVVLKAELMVAQDQKVADAIRSGSSFSQAVAIHRDK